MSHPRVAAAIGMIIALCAATGAAAATKEQLRQQAETLCADDAMRLCGDLMGDDVQTAQCMKTKQAQLSPSCRKASRALEAR